MLDERETKIFKKLGLRNGGYDFSGRLLTVI